MRPDRLGEILEKALSRAGLHHRIQEQRTIDAWERTVGKAVAEMTQPVRVRNRVLQVKVTNSVWMQELQFQKKYIIQKLNECIEKPVLQDLWFFIGEKEEAHEPQRDEGKRDLKGPDRRLSEEEKRRIEREISSLRDPEMKEILLRVFSKGLVAGKSQLINKRINSRQ